MLTDAGEVVTFVEETGVDALAVSVGTAHGVYPSLPELDIDRLRELNGASPVPLVLHGGSGTPPEQIREAVENGICKMNVYADNRVAMGRGARRAASSFVREDPTPRQVFGPIREEISRVVDDKIDLLMAAGRAGAPGVSAGRAAR